MTGERGIGLNLMRTQELGEGSTDAILEAARIAEQAGATEVHVSDHVALSESAHAAREGFPYPIEYPWFEPIALLSAVAAVTERVRLATNVLVAPLRPTILLAKQLATLDAISHGRVSIALGAGWQEEEFEAAGVPFERRVSRLEDQVRACRVLWEQAPAAHSGPSTSFSDLWSLPFPDQGARLPVTLGLPLGPRNIERIVRLADGWLPPPCAPEVLREDVRVLRQACEEAGRDPASLKITAALTLPAVGVDASAAPDPVEEAAALFEAGADVVVAHTLPHVADLDELGEFVAGLVAVARSA